MAIPADRGGAAGLSTEKAIKVNRWMDNPARQTGRYINRVVGAPIHPTNHNALRHNPPRVARVFSGNGSIQLDALNVARLHKIADVAHNKMPVDGIAPSVRQVEEAKWLISYVEENGRLPRRLPDWVDRSGVPKFQSSAVVLRSPSGQRGIRAVLGQLVRSPAVGAGASVLLIESGVNTWQYLNGEIDEHQYAVASGQSAIKAAAVGGAVQVLYVLAATPHGLVVAAVVVGTYIAVDAAIQAFAERFETNAFRASDLSGIVSKHAQFRAVLSDVATPDNASSRSSSIEFQASDLIGIVPKS